jgi:acyl-CoA thioesterase
MQHRKGDDTMPKKISPELAELDRFSKHNGLTYIKWEKGYSRCSLDVNDSLLNPYGTVHGGALFTMADSGMGFALVPALEEGEQCASIEVSIVYLKAIKSGTLICDTTVVKKSSKSAILESEIRSGGQLVAKALGTWIIYKKRD